MAKKKSWQEKLNDSKDLPKVIVVPARLEKRFGKGRMAIPAPKDVDAVMKRVSIGKVISMDEIREKLRKKYDVDTVCPLTTGIFAWIAAHAAAEAAAEGNPKTTPFWRTVKAKGELNPKYPGGLAEQKSRLEAEGHVIVARGKRLFVATGKR